MKLSIVFPMFWGRKKQEGVKDGDYFYDHPTALDEEGTIPALFESLKVLKDRDFDIIAVAGASHPSMAEAVERRAGDLLGNYAARAGVNLHYFSYSQLKRLHDYLGELGKEDLIETVSLVGYSPLRNACLVVAHILNRDITVSIDDDCQFIEADYLSRIKSKMRSDFEGRPILAYCGPYLTPKNSIYLDLPTAPHTVYWNVVEVMNEAFRKYIVESPGVKEVPFAIMGNIAVQRESYMPYPGTFFRDDFLERVTHACTILANDYLTKNEAENAHEALNNIYHARYLAMPKADPFQAYLAFQKKWEEMMGILGEKRAEVQKRLFGRNDG